MTSITMTAEEAEFSAAVCDIFKHSSWNPTETWLPHDIAQPCVSHLILLYLFIPSFKLNCDRILIFFLV